MGRTDNRQPKLTFTGRPSRQADNETPTQTVVPETQLDSEPDDDIKGILREVKTSLMDMHGKLDSIVARLDQVSRKVDRHDLRITNLETRVSDYDDNHTALSSQLTTMNKEMELIRTRNEDLEARSRRNNIRVTGIPESTNMGPIERYMEELLRDLFGTDLSPMFLVERAHRTLGPRPPPGTPPRAILARILNYRDRDTILRLARERGSLTYQNHAIAIYPDFTQAVQSARREFIPAKKVLQKCGAKYAMLYPARLRVMASGKPIFFTDAKAALKFAKQHEKTAQRGERTLPGTADTQLSDVE